METQNGFLQGVADTVYKLELNCKAEEFSLPLDPIDDKRFFTLLELIKDACKVEPRDTVLKTVALETKLSILRSVMLKNIYLRFQNERLRQ
ncbi:hypothetical protein TNCV_3898351 [Trichonephila clavipes]|nr:hypothetical protein TNCV_3898351 [Trichonephila clavipes]